MSNQHVYISFCFFFSIIIAMCLTVLPLPLVLQYWNPDWVLLVLIFWALAFPYHYGMLSSWIVGIFMDVLTGRLLGQYALVYALLAYLCLKFHKRVWNFPLLQQEMFIFSCLLVAHTLGICIERIHNPAGFQWVFLLPVISGSIMWPIVSVTLRRAISD